MNLIKRIVIIAVIIPTSILHCYTAGGSDRYAAGASLPQYICKALFT